MSLTVSNQASLYYNNYTYTNSDSYTENAVNSSAVSKNNYNIENLTNALKTLELNATNDFDSIININNYAKNLFSLSQLDIYEELSSNTTEISNILENNADLSDLYSYFGTNNLVNKAYYQTILGNDPSSATESTTESYCDY